MRPWCDRPSRESVIPIPPLDPQRKRDQVNAALARLEPEGGFTPTPLPAGAPLGAIEVDPDACIMCGVCSRSCPTSAIRYLEEDTVTLQFAEMNCIQCGLCTRICPESAITLKPRIAPAAERTAWRTVNSSDQVHCSECGKPFIAAPLLDSMLRKLEQNTTISPEMHKHMRVCPECRHFAAHKLS